MITDDDAPTLRVQYLTDDGDDVTTDPTLGSADHARVWHADHPLLDAYRVDGTARWIITATHDGAADLDEISTSPAGTLLLFRDLDVLCQHVCDTLGLDPA